MNMVDKGKKSKASKSGEGFESLLLRIEEIVEQLEKGELPLEDSIRLFEEGMKLTSQGMRKLDEAERKVNLLISEGDKEKIEPFPLEEGKEA
jgi:exodeoxyribonuclease VII small subunit